MTTDADRIQAELAAVTAGYRLGQVTITPAPTTLLPPASLTEERVRQIVREELDRLRPVFLPAPPVYRGEP